MQVQAAVISQFGQPFEVNSLDLAAPNDDEVLVRLAAVGICHSDVACQHGAFATTKPGAFPATGWSSSTGSVTSTRLLPTRTTARRRSRSCA